MTRLLLQIAWRQLARNHRRTGLTVGAIAAGLAALGFLWSFSEGLHRNMVRNFQDAIVGSLQVHRKGFFRHPELERHIDRPERIADALERSGVRRWTWRLEAFALAAGRSGSAGSLVIGVDPVREPGVTGLASRVGEGRFLAPDDGAACVVGAGLARSLGLALGDPLVLMTHDRFGALVAEEFRVRGLIASGEMGVDRGLVLVPLAAWQAFLDLDGRVTSVVGRVEPQALTAAVAAVSDRLGDPDYDVLAWHDMFPALYGWVRLSRAFHGVLLVVVLALVLVGVLTTVLLSALDRTRELGVLLAIGMRGAEVRALVATEALLIGALGTLAGVVGGLVLVALAEQSGVDLGPWLGATRRFYLDPVVRPVIEATPWVVTGAGTLLAAGLAGTYPAWVASHLEPAEAIRRA